MSNISATAGSGAGQSVEKPDNSAIIEDVRDLAKIMIAGEKPKDRWRIGTEHEKFGFTRHDMRPLAYDGPQGVGALLARLKDYGWKPQYEGDNVIALGQSGVSITLEPGGQLELSGAPLDNVHQTCQEVNGHLKQVKEVCEDQGMAFLNIGFQPKWDFDDVPVMPKGRYFLMKDYMPKVGSLGLDMMFRSTTVQANMDYGSEADMVKKFRVSLALQPIATAIFANSPFRNGKPTGYLSWRSHVWTDTDRARTGMLPFVFDEGFGYQDYINHALDVPMYFVYRDGYVDARGQSFRDFLEGKLPALPGERPTFGDFNDHLTTLFPEVRLKTFLEMRGADGVPWNGICALPALWAGLLYDEAALDAAWNLVRDWTAEERQTLRDDVPKTALKTPFRNGTVNDIAKEVMAIATGGLKNRGRLNSMGEDERGFLDPLREIVSTGMTRADHLVHCYENDWHGSVDQAFVDCVY